MARNLELRKKRDQRVRTRYEELSQRNPRWRHGEVLKELAQEFFLSERTVSAIFNYEGNTYGISA